MATISFLGGLIIGLLVGWFGLVLLTFLTIRRRKRSAAKPRNHANDIPYTLVTLTFFCSYFPLFAPRVLAALA
jgi:hypothetical protein